MTQSHQTPREHPTGDCCYGSTLAVVGHAVTVHWQASQELSHSRTAFQTASQQISELSDKISPHGVAHRRHAHRQSVGQTCSSSSLDALKRSADSVKSQSLSDVTVTAWRGGTGVACLRLWSVWFGSAWSVNGSNTHKGAGRHVRAPCAHAVSNEPCEGCFWVCARGVCVGLCA